MENLLQDEKVQEILSNVPDLFKNFPPEDLRGFIMTGKLMHFKADEVITRDDSDNVSDAWIAIDGQLAVCKDDIEVGRLGSGDFFGETFLFIKGTRSATIRAKTDVSLIRFERDPVINFFRHRPERLFKIFMMNLLQIQHKRCMKMNALVARLKKQLNEEPCDSNSGVNDSE